MKKLAPIILCLGLSAFGLTSCNTSENSKSTTDSTANKSAQTNVTPNYIPEGWKIPTAADIKKGTGWSESFESGNATPFYIKGDFNGDDDASDFAYLLSKNDNSTWGLWLFIRGVDKPNAYYLGGKGTDPYKPDVLYTGEITNCILSTGNKNSPLCQFGDDETVNKKILTKHDYIIFSVYNGGEGEGLYFDKETGTAERFFSCTN